MAGADLVPSASLDTRALVPRSQGLPQSLTLTFTRPILPSSITLTFAGGFVGTVCTLSTVVPAEADAPKGTPKAWVERNRFFPEDVNRRQVFELPAPEGPGVGADGVEGPNEAGTKEVKVEFEKGSDFFGRITVYELEVWGWQVPE